MCSKNAQCKIEEIVTLRFKLTWFKVVPEAKVYFSELAIFFRVEVDNKINLLVKFHAERSYL